MSVDGKDKSLQSLLILFRNCFSTSNFQLILCVFLTHFLPLSRQVIKFRVVSELPREMEDFKLISKSRISINQFLMPLTASIAAEEEVLSLVERKRGTWCLFVFLHRKLSLLGALAIHLRCWIHCFELPL